jgi:Flp pilus assembly protein TadG
MSPRSALALIRAAWRDVRGVSAIEFAFIAPLLILLYCGMAGLSSVMMAARKTSHAISTLGDLVTQAPPGSVASTISGAIPNEITGAIDMMAPFPTTGGTTLQVRVTSVSVRTDSSIKVDWSCAGTGQSDSTLTPLTLNATVVSSTGAGANLNGVSASQNAEIYALLTTNINGTITPTVGASIIVSQGSYQYQTLANYVVPNTSVLGLPTSFDLANMFFFRPRNMSAIPSPGNMNSGAVCNG